MAKNDRYVVGLDIGTTKIFCAIAAVHESGQLELAGSGEAPSRGMRKGVVVDLNSTAESIKSAVEAAELMAGVAVESATVGIAGVHIRSFNSRGVVTVAGKDRTVARDDTKRVMEAARAVSIPQDREILHVLTQEYVLDDQAGISSPAGLVGSRLEANVHIVTAATTSVQNLVTCVNQAGIEVRATVLEQLAAAEAVLDRDERELGVALIDIGGGTTDLAIFERGAIWHTSVLPAGGSHFTNDLAVGLRTPIPEAERLKLKYGCALSSMVEEGDPIEVPSIGERQPRELSRQVMAEILEPRAEEIFRLVHDEIRRAGFDRLLNAGLVLTGGGSLLPGMVEVAQQVFDLPVRLGRVQGIRAAVDPPLGPQHGTALGLAMFGARHRERRKRVRLPLAPAGRLGGVGGRLRAWLREMF